MCYLMGFGLVAILAKFAPEGIQHVFGRGFPPRVFSNHGGVQVDPFAFFYLVYVVGFLLLRLAPGGYPLLSCLIFNQVST